MHLVLYPKRENLLIGIGIGVAIAVVGRWLFQTAQDPDTASIYGTIGILTTLGGLWLVGSNSLWLWRKTPSFVADEDGFAVMGKRKQPWSKYQGVGIQSLKQGGITTNKWVTVKVGKTPTFARKQHIKWTHLSHDSEGMAARIHAYAQLQRARRVNDVELATPEASAEPTMAMPANLTPTTFNAKAPAQQTMPPRAKQPAMRPSADFADSPIKSGGGGLRGLFGR